MSSDGKGFSATDAPLGHALAEANIRTEAELIVGCKMVRRYKKQLTTGGFSVEKVIDYLKKQERANDGKAQGADKSGRMRKIRKGDIVRGTARIEGSKIILETNYNDDLLTEIKKLVMHKWTGSQWEVAACQENAEQVKNICGRFGIELTDRDGLDDLKPAFKARLLKNKNILSISGGYLPVDRWDADSANPEVDEKGFYALQRCCGEEPVTYNMTLTTWNIHNFLLWIENRQLLNDSIIGTVINSSRKKIISCYQECAEREESKRVISNALSLESSRVNTDWLDEDEMALMPHQQCAVAAILKNKQILVADEQGLGKTIEALVAIEAAAAWPAVVVCPAIARLNWRDEAVKWLPPGRKVKVIGVPKKDEGWSGKNSDLYILNYEIFSKNSHLFKKCKAFVADEAQYLKGYKSSRTVAVKDFLQETKPAYRIFMTGTPIMNRPAELMTILTLLPKCLSAVGGFGYFAARYCRAKSVRSGWTSYLNIKGSGNLDELANRLRSTSLIRREKKDVLPDLPCKQLDQREVTLSNAVEYADVEEDFQRWLASKPKKKTKKKAKKKKHIDPNDEAAMWYEAMGISGLDNDTRHEALRKIGALRQLAGIGKIEASAHIIENFVKDEKLVVFCYHKDVQQQLAKQFPDALKITGEQTPNARARVINSFQSDAECKLIICSLRAAQTAITLTAARRAVFVELDWTPSAMNQAEDRIHRIGQQKQVIITRIVAPNTLDDRISELLTQKSLVINAVNSTGAEVMRHQTSKLAPFGYLANGMPRKQAAGPGRPRLSDEERIRRRKASKASWQKVNSDYMRDYMRRRRAKKKGLFASEG